MLVFRKCPKCGSPNVRRASLRVPDASPPQLLKSPYRCRDCGERFLVTSRSAFQVVAIVGLAVVAVVVGLVASSDWTVGERESDPPVSAGAQLADLSKLAPSGDAAAQ